MNQKIAFFNCSSGISGDMTLSSFINSGLDAKRLERQLKKTIKLGEWGLSVKNVRKGHAGATRVIVTGQRNFHDAAEMRKIVLKSRLSSPVKSNTLKILDKLIAAESKIHGTSKTQVHFHEMNSVDTIVDAAGAALCFEMEGISKAYCSALNLGNPAPATLEIIKSGKLPVFSTTPEFELTTPTGAAIASVLFEPAALPPVMIIEKSGFGAGSFEVPENPNILKLLIGKSSGEVIASPLASGAPARRQFGGKQSPNLEYVILLETNIDDMDPRVYPYVIEKLLKNGALDAWLTNVIMKKGRPGIILSAICKNENEQSVVELFFRETTTIGIRRSAAARHTLTRTKNGIYKTAYLDDGSKKTSIEFEEALKKTRNPGRPPLYIILKQKRGRFY